MLSNLAAGRIRRHRVGLGVLLAAAVVAATVVAATGRGPTTARTFTQTVPAAQGSGLAAPSVPPAGKAYLGAWVQPNSDGTSPTAVRNETAQMGNFQATLGRPLAIVHAYEAWHATYPNSTLATLASSGAIPLVDWECGDTDAAIIAGNDDAMITAYANQLKAYGKPLFLRWYWEMNIEGTSANWINCAQGSSPAGPTVGAPGYVGAWQHIYNIFKGPGGVGATNVSFVWSPGVAGTHDPATLQSLFPGSGYVDWIGIDGFSRPTSGNPDFPTLFGSSTYGNIYGTLSSGTFQSRATPVMIGETGSSGEAQQVPFLQSSLTALKGSQFPLIHAFNYYDGTNINLGNDGQWTLVGAGLKEFATLAADPYFSPMGG